MGNSLSKLKLEALNVNEISHLVTNIGGDYRNYSAAILSSGWDGEYVVFQYDSNSLDLEIIALFHAGINTDIIWLHFRSSISWIKTYNFVDTTSRNTCRKNITSSSPAV
jgi:hypothetical protein